MASALELTVRAGARELSAHSGLYTLDSSSQRQYISRASEVTSMERLCLWRGITKNDLCDNYPENRRYQQANDMASVLLIH